MSKRMDLTGQRFGRLVVIKKNESRNDRYTYWDCKCDCGNIKEVVNGKSLRSGKTRSCGCLSKELTIERSQTHGKTKTKLYGVYRTMKSRCYNENVKEYKYYGGKGITVCDEWLDNFVSFYDWAMDNGYEDGLSIDREENSKGYSPDNCRFVDSKTQCNNRSSNVVVEYKGETKNIKTWVDELELDYTITYQRIRRGWSAERAFETPIKERCRSAS